MLSIGELIEKLVIENIKIAILKEQILTKSAKDLGAVYKKMMMINANRAIVIEFLDKKIESVLAGGKNRILKTVKTNES